MKHNSVKMQIFCNLKPILQQTINTAGRNVNIQHGFLGSKLEIPCPIVIQDIPRELRWYKESHVSEVIYEIDHRGEWSASRTKYSLDDHSGMLIIYHTVQDDAVTYRCRVIMEGRIEQYNVSVILETASNSIAKCECLL